ncbi:MAG: GNAT family N-acetyltransferase [Saprospiraceae bacterium]|nr:GNAT family N-acetyltransferase [Saprospiraceae bacterium]MDW8229163.1 GNAT family N-acetyltransferase [Saprospiraceae bacterium]
MLTELCPLARVSRCVTPAALEEHYAFFPTIEMAAADWEAAAPTDNIFLSRCYLKALEECPPPGMRASYVVFYRENTPIGVAVLQQIAFDGRTHLRDLTTSAGSKSWLRYVLPPVKRWIANCVRGQVMVCGHLLLTGQHGFYFDPRAIGPYQAILLLLRALEEAAQRRRPAAVLIKDVPPAYKVQGTALSQAAYTPFRVQPNMVLPLPYPTFEDYLAAMTTKYRTRAKRAFKKAAPLAQRHLSLREVQQAQQQLHALYAAVARRSGFHWVGLHENYLLALKRHLGDAFHIVGWYRDGVLVGFHTAIENGPVMEAHFLGYNEAVNAECQLYLNMLYDLVRLGIERGSERVVFGRTALEIKSSVGAQPQALDLYLRLQHPIGRRLCAPLLNYLTPREHWLQRHPFKQGFAESRLERVALGLKKD